MKKAIITGVKGQDGALLSKLLLSKGYAIYGCDLPGANDRNLRYLGIDKSIQYMDIDILDLSNVIRMVERYEPDEISLLSKINRNRLFRTGKCLILHKAHSWQEIRLSRLKNAVQDLQGFH